MSRHGMALGFFFGLLIPMAHLPLSAAAAVALRANVPAEVASTLVTNPLTFGPIYCAAWRVGNAILGEPVDAPPAPGTAPQDDPADESWWPTVARRFLGVDKPLLLGLTIMAIAVGIATDFLVSTAGRVSVLWKRHRLAIPVDCGEIKGTRNGSRYNLLRPRIPLDHLRGPLTLDA